MKIYSFLPNLFSLDRPLVTIDICYGLGSRRRYFTTCANIWPISLFADVCREDNGKVVINHSIVRGLFHHRCAQRFFSRRIQVRMEDLTLQWRHIEHDSVSNHQPHDGLLNHLFRRRSKKTSKLRVTGLCAGNSPVTVEFPVHRASNSENVSFLMKSSWFSDAYMSQ